MGLAVDILFRNGSHSHCPCVVLVEIGVDLAGSAEKAEALEVSQKCWFVSGS